MTARYLDRRDAGRSLSKQLGAYARRDDVVVLALPRGGVPVGYEVARALGAPLDVYVVRKLGVPGDEELAMGAIDSFGAEVRNSDVIANHRVSEAAYTDVLRRERAELLRRERLYRGDRPPLALEGRVVVLVDDGLATGATMRAAVQGIRMLRPAAIVVAVPIGDAEVVARLGREADAVVCARTPRALHSVGSWYDDFGQTSDDEVRVLLAERR